MAISWALWKIIKSHLEMIHPKKTACTCGGCCLLLYVSAQTSGWARFFARQLGVNELVVSDFVVVELLAFSIKIHPLSWGSQRLICQVSKMCFFPHEISVSQIDGGIKG